MSHQGIAAAVSGKRTRRRKIDFSHLSVVTVGMCVGWLSSGKRPTDEMLAEAVATIKPALLNRSDMAALKSELDPNRDRKMGRPKGNVSVRERLAHMLGKLERLDVPRLFIDQLCQQLRTRRGYSERDRSQAYKKLHDQQMRNMFLRGLYRDFTPMIKDGGDPVHDVLGPLDISKIDHTLPIHERTLTLVNAVMRCQLRLYPPSLRTMLNIVSVPKKFGRVS
ncbi:MAG: hypothetical protein ABI668_09645 [Sphingorhabdus sp.]